MAEEPATTPEVAQADPVVPESTPPAEQTKPGPTVESLQAQLAKVNNEAAGYRVKLKELEPLAKKQLDADEAKKDEIQKANERAQAAEKAYQDQATLNTQLNLAVTYHLPPEDIDFLGSGQVPTPEEMEDRAKRLAAKNAAAAKAFPPPTDQPIEGLRPGASPEPGKPPDDSYPEQWKPKWLRGDGESRITHGQ
jgi:hypothetical protein